MSTNDCPHCTRSGGSCCKRPESWTSHHPDGTPLTPEVLEHNAYVRGWEHGAADYAPSGRFWTGMRELDLVDVYVLGREDGKAARARAFGSGPEGRRTDEAERLGEQLSEARSIAEHAASRGLVLVGPLPWQKDAR